MATMKQLFLCAPEDRMDAQLRPLIEKWDDQPSSIQILEVLDLSIYGALADDFVVSTLQTMYNRALDSEGITHEANLSKANWRNG